MGCIFQKLKGCFCVWCALFYHKVLNGNAMTKNFYSEPLTGFNKNAPKRLADHQNKTSTTHQKTVSIYDNFMKIMKGKMLAIKDQVKLKPHQVIFNQTWIFETIIFYGRQALSLRGHRDDSQFYYSSLLEFTSVNVGNFIWKLLEIYLKIVNIIKNLGLEIGNLWGQGYDGAGNMAG